MEAKGIKLQLYNVDIEEFAYKAPPSDKAPEINRDELTLSIASRFGHAIDDNLFMIRLRLQIRDPKQSEEYSITLSSNFTFYIQDLKQFVNLSNSQFDMPEYLMTNIVGMALSASRGILIAKLYGTYYHNVYIPIMNISQVVNDMRREQVPNTE